VVWGGGCGWILNIQVMLPLSLWNVWRKRNQ
jgi:hypothetical protein